MNNKIDCEKKKTRLDKYLIIYGDSIMISKFLKWLEKKQKKNEKN